MDVLVVDDLSQQKNSIGLQYHSLWHSITLRITSPKKSLPFYQNYFGMTLVHQIISETCELYYLTTLQQNQIFSSETEDIEKLIMKWMDIKINNGNEEPYRGFGHLAFNCNDVYKASEKLEKEGVTFRKRPDEGRMKGLAFALDPDGYWIEIVGRGEAQMPEEFNLSQTMIRIKETIFILPDPKISIPFYRDILGMTVVREMHMSDFSNYFLATLPKDTIPPVPANHVDAKHFVHELWNPCLELTHNHGTEKDERFHYHNGNTNPKGFSHLAFLVDNVEHFCEKLDEEQKKRGLEITSEKMAILADPDGYVIQLLQRGNSDHVPRPI